MFRRIRVKSLVSLCVLTATLSQTLTCPISEAYTQQSLTTTLLSNLSGVLNDTLFFILDSTFVNIA